ncbi:hypothetical protein CSB20_12555 [bacterium DOLZORAL124_64_63]|nr:MAG: hypothetical protein CSB20_12555 [bacterium DOLZORAL124_64_63]
MMTATNRKTAAGTRRRMMLVGLGLFTHLAIFLPQFPARADDGDHTRDLIRAAMVYNFCKFVDWPAEKQAPHLVLGVVAAPDRVPDFSSIDGKRIHKRSLQVRPVTSGQELVHCDLVFINQETTRPLADILADIAQKPVLTISEMENFCTRGGIIQIVPRRGKMRFFINRRAAGEAGLVLSSQLLKMARIVEGGKR